MIRNLSRLNSKSLGAVFFVAMAMICLASCTSINAPEGKPLPNMTFSHMERLSLDVGSVVREQGEVSALQAVRDAFAVRPEDVFENYVAHRFLPKPGFGNAQLRLVYDIHITQDYERSEYKAASWAGVGGRDAYILQLSLLIVGQDLPRFATVQTSLNVTQKVSISQHASISERELKQFEAFETLMAQLDRELINVLRNDFGIL